MANAPSYTTRILALIAASGETGMTFTEIQKALFEMSHTTMRYTRADRGWWCCNLTGHGTYDGRRHGLLNVFCTKTPSGRWVRNNVPHVPNHAWAMR